MVDGLQLQIRTGDPSAINHIPYTINTISLLINNRQRSIRRLRNVHRFIGLFAVAVDNIKNRGTDKNGKE
jgi:hypothetical protein